MNSIDIKIGSFNIQGGLSNKCIENELITLVKGFDIFCFQESWLTENQTVQFQNYEFFRSDRRKGKKLKRGN